MPECKALVLFWKPDPRQHFLAGLLRTHPVHRLACPFCGKIVDTRESRDRELAQHADDCELKRAIILSESVSIET